MKQSHCVEAFLRLVFRKKQTEYTSPLLGVD